MPSKVRFAFALLVAFGLAAVPVRGADESVEEYSFTVPNPPESTVDDDRFTLTLNRWSTDAERDRMLKIIEERGKEHLLEAFRNTGVVGYLQWPGGLEYSVRYAYRSKRPDGGSDVVLLVDRPLWVWWDAGTKTDAGAQGDARFGVIQLRLDARDTGEGRIASGTNVASDDTLGVLVSDYESRPVMLDDVG